MKKLLLGSLLVFAPIFVSAQTNITDFNSLTSKFQKIGDSIVVLLVAVAIIWIIYNVVIYLISTNDAEKRKKGGYAILFGIIGLFVIVSIWGLVGILTGTFKFGNNEIPRNIPKVPNIPRN